MQDEMRKLEAKQQLRALVLDLLEDFPPLDPESDFYGGYIDPAEVVEYLRDGWAREARTALNVLSEA